MASGYEITGKTHLPCQELLPPHRRDGQDCQAEQLTISLYNFPCLDKLSLFLMQKESVNLHS